MVNNPNLTLLQARDFAMRWAETDSVSLIYVQHYQISLGQKDSVMDKEEMAERIDSRLIHEKISKFASDSDIYREWISSLHKDSIELKENLKELRQYQQFFSVKGLVMCLQF